VDVPVVPAVPVDVPVVPAEPVFGEPMSNGSLSAQAKPTVTSATNKHALWTGRTRI